MLSEKNNDCARVCRNYFFAISSPPYPPGDARWHHSTFLVRELKSMVDITDAYISKKRYQFKIRKISRCDGERVLLDEHVKTHYREVNSYHDHGSSC